MFSMSHVTFFPFFAKHKQETHKAIKATLKVEQEELSTNNPPALRVEK